MPRKRSDNPAAVFQMTVRAALEHLHDPTWLATHSPLATAYFLGDRTARDTDGRATSGGYALQALLTEAMDRLWDGSLPPTAAALVNAVEEARREGGNAGDEYAYLLLELRYFRRHFVPGDYPAQATDIPVFVNVSSTRFFVHLDRAIDRLGEELLRLSRPAMRPERPPTPALLLGRDRELTHARRELAAGRSVTLSGAAGVGKTTLGAAVVAERPLDSVFWYTFLPNFNDNLPGLLFALGYFLHALGRSMLWRQLVADRGRALDPEQSLGLLRADLAALPVAPLFCFDEVDLLHTSDGDARSAAHAQLLAFLEALCRTTQVLLIGQRGYIDTPAHIALEPLDAGDTAALLAAAGLNLTRRQVERVREVTDGLPRLVELVIALVQDGDDLDEIVRLHLRADARPLFNRLWRRLDRPERELLIALSVFRSPAPGDAWPKHAAACYSLQARRLLTLNDAGEVALMSFYRRLVHEELRPEQREAAHAQAGRLRTARGEFTASAYHYVCAGEPEMAVSIWFPNRELEIERGQAGAALDIFGILSIKRLSQSVAGKLKVIQNQLYLLAGQTQRVIDNMAGFEWEINDVVAAEAYYQTGDAYRGRGEFPAALIAYEQAITAITDRIAVAANSIMHRAKIYLTDGELDTAYAEARRAHQFAESLDGFLAMFSGRFAQAEEHFQSALHYGNHNNPSLSIELNKRLGFIAGSQGDMKSAESYYQVAMDYYERIGDVVNLEGVRADLGGVYLNLREFDRLIPIAERGLQFFESIRFQPRVEQITASLAEAYLETERYEEATVYAHRLLTMEVPRWRPYALYTLGLVHQRQGRPEHAAVSFADGIRTAQNNHDRFIEAYLHRLDGRLRLEQGDAAAGRAALETALAMFAEMGIEREAGATREELRVTS